MGVEANQRDLAIVIEHLEAMDNEDGSEEQQLQKAVSARLRNELRMMEIEAMRKHILSCPDLERDSPAIEAALRAVDEVQKLIESNGVIEDDDSPSMMISLSNSEEELHGLNGSANGSVGSSSPRSLPDTPESKPTSSEPIKAKPTCNRRKPTSRIISVIGTILRMIVLDLPFVSTLLLFVCAYCGKHTYTTYIEPTMDALTWNEKRMSSEYTHYSRKCDISDISTLNPDDFIIDPNTQTPEEAAGITYKHGMSIFPNILTPETAAKMREYVIQKNEALNDDDAIPLISQEHRWSFPIGGADDPSIPPVLREIATHPMLQSSLKLLMGEDPAMVEFTAITSAYGAGDQHWHADNDFTGSQMHYARSFVSMYSLFIPLQDTTTAMGATSACPGTHLCGDEEGLADLCDELNFQVSDSRGRLAESQEDHVWKSGDGYLFNLNVYHRGPGHTDPAGKERVMLIMTISPRPKGPHFDRRQISLGTSYSSKWDSWGLTMKDLVEVEKAYALPAKILRLLGVYKTGKWGWDYITVACSRIVNDQMGFRFEDLELFVDKVRSKNEVMNFIFGHIPDEEDTSETGWREFLREVCKRSVLLASALSASCFLLYVSIGAILTRGRMTYLTRATKMTSFIGIVSLMILYLQHRTPWAQDIQSGKHMTPIFMDSSKFREPLSASKTFESSTTFPKKHDVLIGTRLDDPYLAYHNKFLNQQNGNAIMQSMVEDYAGNAPNMMKAIAAKTITEKIQKLGGKFLQQDAKGDWATISSKQATSFVQKRMNIQSNPVSTKIHEAILFQMSECRHGRMRSAVMSTKHGLEYLNQMDNTLFASPQSEIKATKTTLPFQRTQMPPLSSLRRKKTTTTLKDNEIKAGDIIEAWFGEDDGWFRGKVRRLNGDGSAFVVFDDGDIIRSQALEHCRLFKDFVAGDQVKTTFDDTEGVLVSIGALGNVVIETDDGEMISDVLLSDLRHYE